MANLSQRFTLAVAAAGLTALLAVGGASCDSGGGGDRAGVYRVAVIPKGLSHVFWNSIEAGARLGAREIEKERDVRVEIIWQGPESEREREKQRQILESFMGPGVDGIVLAPIDEHALAAPVAQLRRTGKPVVIFDSALRGEAGKDFESFVATDNRLGGVRAAEEMGRVLDGKGKVLVLRYQVGSASTTKREQGFIETIREKFPDIELVPPGLDQYAGASAGEAQNVAETLLTKYRDIRGIFCPNESSATGMLEALSKSPLVGQVKFIGFDSSEKLIQALEDDRIHALVLQDPVRMGSLAVRTLIDVIQGKEVARRIDTGVHLVTRANMKEPEMARLLRPDHSILRGK